MAKIENSPQHRAKLGYTSHDVSRQLVFSAPLAQILPVYYDFLCPGEKVNFSCQMFTRTEPLVKPAFAEVVEHVDWFFVPMTQLFQFFGDVYFGVQDFKTNFVDSLYDSTVEQHFPVMNLDDIFACVYNRDEDHKVTDLTDWGKDSDMFGVPHAWNVRRMLSLLGLTPGVADAADTNSDVVWSPGDVCQIVDYSVTPFWLAAYQKIFMDYYRLDDWTANDPHCYNFDDYLTGLISDHASISSDIIKKLFTIRYIPWSKDYFSNFKPSPLFGMESLNALNNGLGINNWQQSGITSILQTLGLAGDILQVDMNNPTTVGPSNPVDTGGFQTKLTTANLRGMFATEKLLEITRRAGKHYDKQVLAHFGVEVPQGITGEVMHLAHDSNRIRFEELTSLADTLSSDESGQALGSMAGKGIGFNDKEPNRHEFRAPCHGILMAVHYNKSDTFYNARTHLDKLNVLNDTYDFYHPELDNLTMQPLFGYEWYFLNNATYVERPSLLWDNSLVAWQYQFSQFKTKYDFVSGKFNYGENRSWIPQRDMLLEDNMEARMYQNPSFLDPIFALSFLPSDSTQADIDDEAGIWCERDPFLHVVSFNVYKTSTMSTYSLPNM